MEAKDLEYDFMKGDLFIYTREGVRQMFEDMNEERRESEMYDDEDLVDIDAEMPEGSELDVYIDTIHDGDVWVIKHEDINVFFEYYDSDEYEELEEDDVDYRLFELYKEINML